MNQKHISLINVTSSAFPYLLSVFCSIIILGNIYALKITTIFGMLTPSGIICFPFTFSICDIITEAYGSKAADRAIKTGLGVLIIYFISLQLVTFLEPAPGWQNQHAWETIFLSSPRIIAGTFVAYYLGEKVNSQLLAFLNYIFNGKFFLRRSLASTFSGVFIDTLVFNFIAFFGSFPIKYWVIFTFQQLILKMIFEFIGSLLASLIVPSIIKNENLDPIKPGRWMERYWKQRSKKI